MTERPMLMFGGKGGVGKTTCSAAIALQLSSSGRKTLILTSDAAPSLSDIFEEEIGDEIRSVEQNLDAVEISEGAILQRWKEKFGPDFYEILSHLIDVEALDTESRHQLLDYIGSAPSLREETMLDLIVALGESGGYDRIIWDTAPAGETLNLLSMPTYIKNHISAGARVFEGLDRIGKKIVGKRSIAQIMDEWIAVSERISRYILSRSAFVIVANPEALVVNQVRRSMETVKEYRIALRGLVINRVVENADPAFDAMRDAQGPHLLALRELAQGLPVARLPFELGQIRGKEVLRNAGKALVRDLTL